MKQLTDNSTPLSESNRGHEATSDSDIHRWESEGGALHHGQLIDSRSGLCRLLNKHNRVSLDVTECAGVEVGAAVAGTSPA